jgi:hypothetical protein
MRPRYLTFAGGEKAIRAAAPSPSEREADVLRRPAGIAYARGVATTIGPNEMLIGGALIAIGLLLSILRVKSVPVRAILGAVLAALVVFGLLQYRRVRSIPSTSGGQEVTYFADPKVLLDEDVAVNPRASQGRRFSLPGNEVLAVSAAGKGRSERPFIVHVMSADDFEAFSKKRPFHYAPAFEALATQVSRTDVLPPGNWVVVVDNSDNASAATVHVRVVVNPG